MNEDGAKQIEKAENQRLLDETKDEFMQQKQGFKQTCELICFVESVNLLHEFLIVYASHHDHIFDWKHMRARNGYSRINIEFLFESSTTAENAQRFIKRFIKICKVFKAAFTHSSVSLP